MNKLSFFDGSLQLALSQARQFGWQLVRGDLVAIAREIAECAGPIRVIRTRKTDDDVRLLRPQSSEVAPPRSLSAQHGCGPFPFHTDGAHLERPPNFLLMASKGVGDQRVPTHVLRFPTTALSPQLSEDIRLGVFRVDAGANSFYTTSRYDDGVNGNCIRFDPGCMRPVDPRARRLVQTISATSPDHSHSLTDPNEILIIDNLRVLHSRGDASHAPGREIYRLLLSWTGESGGL